MIKKARVIQICGTGSGVGKSILVAGLCRVLQQQGYRVAPFKAQNMALNSAVTQNGGEIGRAQAMQAAACKIEPTVDMNPVLLKPTSNVGSQVIVRGKAIGNMSAVQYYEYKTEIFDTVKKSLKNLMLKNDVVVIEGAGSPAEINLKKHDIVNMRIARLLNAPVLLVGDIDCGGVFAWLLGTLSLLTKNERRLVKGFVINKFRGDKSLLMSGLNYLEKKSRKKVFGVLPYYRNIMLPQEDSLFFNQPKLKNRSKTKSLHIAIVKLPHIANFTDFDCISQEGDVILEYTQDIKTIRQADCVIVPGSKNTLSDMIFLNASGLAEEIKKRAGKRGLVVGICGGFQMLGKYIADSFAVESLNKRQQGLNLLSIATYFENEKITYQVQAMQTVTKQQVTGYEIHHGKTIHYNGCKPMFMITRRGNKSTQIADGACNNTGNVWGTYIHGVFDNTAFRTNFLNDLRNKKGLKLRCGQDRIILDREFNKLADLLHEHLDIKALKEIIFSQKVK